MAAAVALIASPAWAQIQLMPKIKSATARADPCAPIGKTAKDELVFRWNATICRRHPHCRRRPRSGRPRRPRSRRFAEPAGLVGCMITGSPTSDRRLAFMKSTQSGSENYVKDGLVHPDPNSHAIAAIAGPA